MSRINYYVRKYMIRCFLRIVPGLEWQVVLARLEPICCYHPFSINRKELYIPLGVESSAEHPVEIVQRRVRMKDVLEVRQGFYPENGVPVVELFLRDGYIFYFALHSPERWMACIYPETWNEESGVSPVEKWKCRKELVKLTYSRV